MLKSDHLCEDVKFSVKNCSIESPFAVSAVKAGG